MNEKLAKCIGVVGLFASCAILYFGAKMDTNTILSLGSKVLGIVTAFTSGFLTFFKNKEDK